MCFYPEVWKSESDNPQLNESARQSEQHMITNKKEWTLATKITSMPFLARIIPLDHWALLYSWWQVEETKPGLLHSPCQNFYTCAYESLYSSVAERWSCKPKVMSSILIGGKRFLQTQTSKIYIFSGASPLQQLWWCWKAKKFYDPDVIRTRSLLIWSQTRYRCATESIVIRFHRDLNSDRWIQSPEC